jgi:CRISPR type III-A-associated RAMP protein Csm5
MKIKIKILAPVHIGSGNKISPLEYVSVGKNRVNNVFDGNFIRLNMESLFADEGFRPRIEPFINSAKQASNRYVGNLLPANLLLSHTLYKLPVSPSATGRAVIEVSEFVKSAGNVFIPGSSIKGALLSAVIHKIAKQKNIRNLREYNELLKNVLEEISEGKSGRFSRWLDVTDTNLIAPDTSLEISYAESRGRGKSIPVVYETLRTGTEFEFEMKTGIEDFYQFGKLSCEEILEASNDFYTKILRKSRYNFTTSHKGFLLRLGQGSSVLSTSLLLLAEELNIRNYKVFRPRGSTPLSPGQNPTTAKLIGRDTSMGWAVMQIV